MDVEANDQTRIMRGKRSKRSRLSITTTSGSTSGGSFVDNPEEDQDMANCLIMLAQSGRFEKPEIKVEKPEFHVYECKSCNRSFSSFQALGGHRASHKKHKSDQEKQVVICNDLQNEGSQVLVPLRNLNPKIHECSICGMEFASGQALGGHMRRHRSNSTTNINTPTNTVSSDENTRNVLQLDLNFPAPEENHLDSKFQLLCSSPMPALVGCHY